MNESNIWAIIQGPVISPGRNYKTTLLQIMEKFETEKDLIVNFNSEQTIINNVKELKKYDVNTIYSGWENDCTNNFIDNLKEMGVKVVLSNPNEAKSFYRIHFNGNFKSEYISINNKTKQYLSFLRGFDIIPDNLENIKIIKLRSDISLNFKELIYLTRKNNRGIIVQYLIRDFFNNFKAYLPDFWFAGDGKCLYEIFKDLYIKSNNISKEYSDLPHYDIAIGIINYYNELNFNPSLINEEKININFSIKDNITKLNINALKSKLIFYFKLFKLNREMNKLIKRNLIKTGNQKIEHSIIWRGNKNSDNLGNKIFQELDNEKKYINFNQNPE